MSQTRKSAVRLRPRVTDDPATRSEWIAAGAFALAFALAGCVVASTARLHLRAFPSFVLLVETLAVASFMLASSALFTQYRARRFAPLAILSYAFAAFGTMHAVYAATFPGVLAPGALGAGEQSAGWAYTFGRSIFDVLVAAYIAAERSERDGRPWSRRRVRLAGVLVGAALVGVTLLATVGHRWLPALLAIDGRLTPLSEHVLDPVLLLAPLAIVFSLLRLGGFRTHTDLWLALVLLATVSEIVFGGVLSDGRYTLAWYWARLQVPGSVVFFVVVLQLQVAGIVRRSARANARSAALFEVVSDAGRSGDEAVTAILSFAGTELDFSSAFVARGRDGAVTFETVVGPPPAPSASAELATSMGIASDVVVGREVVCVPLFVDGARYGVVAFAANRPRWRALDTTDRDFLRILAIAVASSLEREGRTHRLSQLAFLDALTGLANRTSLLARLEERVREGRAFAVHFLDLDRFKAINDAHGHAVGDEVLFAIGQRLQRSVREGDTVARLGGDEFVVLQEIEHDPDEAVEVAARITALGATAVRTSAGLLDLGVSVGTACFPRDARDAAGLLAAADAAQYRHKHGGSAPRLRVVRSRESSLDLEQDRAPGRRHG